ncbi:MAG TPA: DsbA family oxidoreductase [Steroidobacteraceae bacterium]|nr:DsbA family oxidoreductase [Steroidobacteraceae bacterium]
MAAKLRLDFVSDIACPWCVVGLKSLETALDRLGKEVEVELHFQPFELNPQMPKEGEDIAEHIARKYGSTPEQGARNRENIRTRGAELGFTFNMEKRGRIYNTFDAHRLLHWAEAEGKQRELKMALFDAYFTDGQNPSEHPTLIEAAVKVGLEAARAKSILESGEFTKEVREQEQFYLQNGIQAVPSVIINNRHLIQGGQPPEVFERALRELAKEAA